MKGISQVKSGRTGRCNSEQDLDIPVGNKQRMICDMHLLKVINDLPHYFFLIPVKHTFLLRNYIIHYIINIRKTLLTE